MLKLSHLSLRRGARLLLREVDLTLHAGQKVGLVGANGAGKSTLFAAVRGELAPDAGELSLPSWTVIAHVAQETAATDRPALDHVMDGDAELRQLQAELLAAESQGDGMRQAELLGRLDAIGAHAAQSRAARLLHGLGFGDEQMRSPVATFSGGWRMRLNLAQALMCRSDLLLLDEPTNHLDLDAVLWLEEWLRAYSGTLLLVSHDRDFLDAVVHHILLLERQTLRLYAGNYSDFEVQRAQELTLQQAAYERQQREVVHIRRFVDRFRAKATKARQAQSRLKALARMELIAPAHVDSPFQISFPQPDKLPSPLLRLERAAVGYDGRPVVSNAGLSILPGDRIALLGPNGAGKSTLVRLLAGDFAPLAGRRDASPDLRVGYFAQHQIEQLDLDATPLVHLRRLDSRTPEQAMRDFLGGFGFSGDAALAPVAPLSGGEKARLVLALLVYQRPNLLLLDEPTNHLDLEMRHALSLALQDFDGAVVLVSHDRHLVRTTADTLLLVYGGALRTFEGDLEDYARWLAERRASESVEPQEPALDHGAAARKDRRREAAERRRQLQPRKAEVQRIEAAVERLSGEKARIEAQLADPNLYRESEKVRLKELLLEQARVDHALSQAEDAWLAACEALEDAERADTSMEERR
jgi:ATP-binding cassette, subfamily F, member 3